MRGGTERGDARGMISRRIVVLVCFAGPAWAADADLLTKVKAAGVLKIGTDAAFAPFDFFENGATTGFNYDLMAEVAKEIGVRVSYIALPWEGVVSALDASKFDMVTGPATITKARMERYRFTLPIADATCALLKKAGDQTLTKPADIAGKPVGSAKATAQLDQLRKFSATLPAPATIREYQDFNAAYADLAAGHIAAVANSLSNIAYVAAQRSGSFALVSPAFGDKSYFAYFVRKDSASASLADALDAALRTIKGDGRLEKLQQKWFGMAFETPDAVPPPSM